MYYKTHRFVRLSPVYIYYNYIFLFSEVKVVLVHAVEAFRRNESTIFTHF